MRWDWGLDCIVSLNVFSDAARLGKSDVPPIMHGTTCTLGFCTAQILMAAVTEAALIELIACAIPSAADLVAYLRAWPSAYLTASLQHLLELVALMPLCHLWPHLRLPRDKLRDARILQHVHFAIALYPSLDVDFVFDSTFVARPATRVRLRGLTSPAEFAFATAQWGPRITSLALHVHDHKAFEATTRSWTTADVSHLVAVLPTLTSLRDLDLTWSATIPKADIVLTSLQMPSLRRVQLTLQGTAVWTTASLAALAAWLHTAHSLTELSLRHVVWDVPDAGMHLATMLRASSPRLSVTMDVDASARVQGSYAFQLQMTPMRATETRLVLASLDNTCTTDDVVATLVPTMHANTVNGLLQYDCTVYDVALPASSVSRLKPPQLACLHTLTMSTDAMLGDDGMIALAAAMAASRPRFLRDLCLDGQGIGNDGARALAVALTHLPSLDRLRLASNHMRGSSGVVALVDAWPPRLRLLDLSNNPLAAKGARALLSALAALEMPAPIVVRATNLLSTSLEIATLVAASRRLPPFRTCFF
ncbi:hypothetical protein SDRG_09704 [Saprolegnia diclina VS20]|uniref:Uncharacterized protein n=1 Tax=Saprolegnia diclina (strain VS20) TaxID=1156394 RepID=T0RRI4_SAPDV|nr:hypothetical protein SDRG_09704 [Saprolegnia diclina VS20]EQC32732.1 hypothetical protein SDRG_09704 [Saprolegnia diclina VS20]|eukprot:XP_008613876.1 hypothetical protein SDRG_09704 [Saprolegnia diclina VS20]